jgi:CRP-like cAMP-binding protein
MSIEDDVALFEQVPTLRLLGREALRNLAFGSETREVARNETLFRAGDTADAGFVVQSGSFRVSADHDSDHSVTVGSGTLIGELALMVAMKRPSTAVALEFSTTVRISRSLFQRVLEAHPDGAQRLRDELANRTSQVASDLLLIGGRLTL